MKCRVILFIIFQGFSINLYAQSPSASDIFIGEIKRSANGLSVVNLKQVTDNVEYTNQPYFFDDKHLYFTQEVKGVDGQASQMDIFRYDVSSNQSTNLTNSSDSEYSATPTPDGVGFSVIKVNSANKQELWQITFSGKPKQQLANAIEPVGYQVWMQDDKVLLFVLGEPHTLRMVDPFNPDDAGHVIAESIGPSLHRMPHTQGYTFTVEAKENTNSNSHDRSKATHKMTKGQGASLWLYSPLTGKKQALTNLPVGATYYAWTPNSELLSTDENKLLAMPFLVNRNKRSGLPVESTVFSEVEIEGKACKKGISRLAVSPYDEKIALVCVR